MILREDPFPVDLLGSPFQRYRTGPGAHLLPKVAAWFFNSQPGPLPNERSVVFFLPTTLPPSLIVLLYSLPLVLWKACTSLAILQQDLQTTSDTALCHQWCTRSFFLGCTQLQSKSLKGKNWNPSWPPGPSMCYHVLSWVKGTCQMNSNNAPIEYWNRVPQDPSTNTWISMQLCF